MNAYCKNEFACYDKQTPQYSYFNICERDVKQFAFILNSMVENYHASIDNVNERVTECVKTLRWFGFKT